MLHANGRFKVSLSCSSDFFSCFKSPYPLCSKSIYLMVTNIVNQDYLFVVTQVSSLSGLQVQEILRNV